MIPFDFVVQGLPTSQQTKNRQRLQAWMQRVRQDTLIGLVYNDDTVCESIRIVLTESF